MLRALCQLIEKWAHQSKHQHKELMAALDNLTAAVTRLQASVDAAVTEITTPHATDAQVQSAADAVNAQSARLDAAVASQQVPVPTPAPPPAPAPAP